MGKRVSAQGVLLVLGSCVSLQFGSALATQLFPVIGTWGTTFFRLFFSGVILLAVFRPRVFQWSAAQWRGAILFALSIGLMNSVFYVSISRIPLGTAVAIEFLGPLVLAALLSRSLRDATWVAVAFLGMALFAVDSLKGESLDSLGVLLALLAGVFWACYILAAEKLGRLGVGGGGLAVGLFLGALVPLPLGYQGIGPVLSDPGLLALAVGTAVLASLLPYSFEYRALRSMPSNAFSILLALEPVIAAIAGWLLLGQQMTPWAMGAIALIVLASAGTSRAR